MEYIPEIFCTNCQIFIETLEQLQNVPGELYTFKSTDDGNKKVLKSIADHNLHVKIGMPVMLLYNIDNKLVNGSRGKVVAIDNGVPVTNFKEAGRVQKIDKKSWDATDFSRLVAKRTQFPLKPCWGITPHKSQGQSLKAAVVISGNEFAPGQLYVACSRVFTKSRLCLKGFDLRNLIKPPKVVTEFYDKMKGEPSELKADFSCCREKSFTEDIDLIELTPLDDLDISLLEDGFESNLDVLVLINDDDDLFEQGILMEDSEPDVLISEQDDGMILIISYPHKIWLSY